MILKTPPITLPLITLCVVLITYSCVSSTDSRSSRKRGGDPLSNNYDDEDFSSEGAPMVMGGTVINSVSNNPLTSHTIRSQQALEHALSSTSKSGSIPEEAYLDALTATRLGGGDINDILEHARSLMLKRISRSQKDLPELAKLEIGLAAIQAKNLARAKIFLDPLLSSTKNPRIKASILNGYGIAALQLGQTTDGAKFFKRSLQASANYAPALFNLGFLALKFGHYRKAQKYLSSLQNDWYARTGLITADRQSKRNSRVTSLCSSLSKSKPRNKVVLFNCGLFYLQNLKDRSKARSFIERATQQPGGEASWDETAFKVLEKIQ